MTRSRVRQESVHTRGSRIDDGLDPPDHDATADDLAETLDFYASQFRKITGKSRWETAPAKTIEELASGGITGEVKSGVLIPGDFSGNPKRATVSFSTAFPSTAYSVTLASATINRKGYSPHVESKVPGGFVVDLGSNNLADLVEIGWHAIETGEF